MDERWDFPGEGGLSRGFGSGVDSRQIGVMVASVVPNKSHAVLGRKEAVQSAPVNGWKEASGFTHEKISAAATAFDDSITTDFEGR